MCRHNKDESIVGTQYQCEGDLYASIDFELLGDNCTDTLDASWCAQQHFFGSNQQPYAAAEVVACCGEWDPEYKSVFQEHCAYDMYQQLCITLSARFEDAIKDGQFGIYSGQATEIQIWIAQHYTECFQALLNNNAAALPEVDSHWDLGDFGAVHDVVLKIDAPTKIYGVNLPVDEDDWLTCNGVDQNNDVVFEDGHSPNGGVVVGVDLATELDARLVGPSILGGTVTAAATFDATCGARGCPAVTFSYDVNSSLFTIEEFDLFTDAVVFTNGTYFLTADRAQISLWTQAEGYEVLDPTSELLLGYEIPAGAAHFLVSGSSDITANRFMAVNVTDIWIVATTSRTWEIGSFDIEYEDGANNLWTLTLGDSRWD